MLRYAVRRLFGFVPTLLIIITVSFFMMRLAPGNPFLNERATNPNVQRNIEAKFGLDRPLIDQYFLYMGNVLQGDFGPSFKSNDFSVGDLISSGFPVSAKLGGIAILIAILVGMSLGIIAALRQNTWGDYTVMTIAMTGIALPNFVIAPMLTLFIGLYWGLLPVGGWSDSDFTYWILPITALTLPQIAAIARLTRGSMIEVLRSNYVRTAKAKGLPIRMVINRHALRGAIAPIISYIGPAIAQIITGSLVIEKVFTIPGIGTYFIDGALNRDYTLVMGVTIFYGALIVIFNLIVDLLYGVIDPKVRYD